LRKHTKLPIGLKGVQSVEDAKRAMEAGVDAIYLSNHGLVSLPCFRQPSNVVLLRSVRRILGTNLDDGSGSS
jgi:isopentenyl diphosphate isomerase/L-lactate dehydrogenase-like FMN-dependent dehydrogenase